jgi:hypothetical protein
MFQNKRLEEIYKINQIHLRKVKASKQIKLCVSRKADVLITKLNPDDTLFTPYKERGITVL